MTLHHEFLSIRAAKSGEEVQINNSLTEGVLSAIMNHPNIVRSLGYEAVVKRGATDGATHEIRLLMEFCDRGSLDKAVASGCFHEDYDGMLKVRHNVLLLFSMLAACSSLQETFMAACSASQSLWEQAFSSVYYLCAIQMH